MAGPKALRAPECEAFGSTRENTEKQDVTWTCVWRLGRTRENARATHQSVARRSATAPGFDVGASAAPLKKRVPYNVSSASQSRCATAAAATAAGNTVAGGKGRALARDADQRPAARQVHAIDIDIPDLGAHRRTLRARWPAARRRIGPPRAARPRDAFPVNALRARAHHCGCAAR